MNKIKMSRAQVVAMFPRCWSLGYCSMQNALGLLDGARGYTCGVYGWNYDIYDVGGVGVCTGYRDMPGAGVPSAFVEKWERRARRVVRMSCGDYGKYKRARARFARSFRAAFAALRLPRVEFVRGSFPVVPSWARRARVVRGGAWFYDDGRGVKGARVLHWPAVDPSRDGVAGWSFVLRLHDFAVIRRHDPRDGGAASVPVCRCLADRVAVCSADAGCFYYLGRGDIGAAAGRPLCGNVGGRYESGAAARYVERLAACPCGRWVNGK